MRKQLNFFTVLLCICITNHSYATLKIHQWQSSHRGYSVEEIPGNTSPNREFVAVGTAYNAIWQGSISGWHFMRLDENGNVLADRISRANGWGFEFKAIDIEIENPNKFWITMLARNISSGEDYIYVAGVDANGADLPTNPAIAFRVSDLTYGNVYPTHSYYSASENTLYICGYACPDSTGFPKEPTSSGSSKVGMLARINVNASPVTANATFWNTTNGSGGTFTGLDFDMPLKISPYSAFSEFPLVVTGAINHTDQYSSSILVASFDNATNVGLINGVLPLSYLTSQIQPRPFGCFGIDLVGLPHYDNSNDIDRGILYNAFDEYDPLYVSSNLPSTKTWGIIRLDGMYPYPAGTLSSQEDRIGGAWAKQFVEYQDNFGTEDIYWPYSTIVGERITQGECISLPGNSLAPGLSNVNPFVGHIGWNSAWTGSAWSGYTLPSLYMFDVYFSSKGTRATSLDYLIGWNKPTSALEDVSRLYTFSSSRKYSTNTQAYDLSMVLPIGEYSAGGPVTQLGTKYMGLTYWGSYRYDELECLKHDEECLDVYLDEVYRTNTEISLPELSYSVIDAYTLFNLYNQFNNAHDEFNCSDDLFRTTAVAQLQQEREITISPNPASTEINISFSRGLSQGEVCTFSIVDMTGKQVFIDKIIGRDTNVALQLPSLVPGMYSAIISINGSRRIEKLAIQ